MCGAVVKIVAVDINQDLSLEHITRISSVLLQEVVVLATQAKPLFLLLFCLSTHIEVLFPLQLVVPGNLHMLKCSIETLVLFYRDTILIPRPQRQTISQCVDYIYSSAQRLANSNNTTDILFLTGQTKLKSELEEILLEKSQCLNKKVTVVTLSDKADTDTVPVVTDTSSPHCFTELDEFTISSLYIQSSIRRWLFATEKRLLKIQLPNKLTLSCDLEPLLLTDLLSAPVRQLFSLSTVSATTDHESQDAHEPQLKVTRLIPANLVCESVLFGNPLLLKSSTHYQLEWELLEKNQQNFLALCHTLRKKDMWMLCERVGELRSLFLFLPGPAGCALIKPIACSELLLPVAPAALSTVQPHSALVESSLSELEVATDKYSPLEHPSALHQYLVDQIKPVKRKLYNENTNKRAANSRLS